MLTKDVFLIQRANPFTGTREYWHEDTIPCEFVEEIEHATRYASRKAAYQAARPLRIRTRGSRKQKLEIVWKVDVVK